MAKNRNVEIIAGTSFIWKGKLVRAGTKIKVPAEFYFREIELQKKRGAKLHKLLSGLSPEPEPEPDDSTPPPPPPPPPLDEPLPQPDGGGTNGYEDSVS